MISAFDPKRYVAELGQIESTLQAELHARGHADRYEIETVSLNLRKDLSPRLTVEFMNVYAMISWEVHAHLNTLNPVPCSCSVLAKFMLDELGRAVARADAARKDAPP